MPATLDRITTKDRRFLVDSTGRSVILRGLVTLTAHNLGGPIELTEDDFARMRAWGFNAQVIRLEAGRLGILGTSLDPAYLDKLDRWTTWAATHGIYTMFKLTTYDVPSQIPSNSPFDRSVWERFWSSADLRTDRIEGWRRVWRRFAGRCEVVGYDVLNEPSPGHEDPQFARKDLFPFYEDVAVALREVDREALLLVQPDIGTAWWRDIHGEPRHAPGASPHGAQVRMSDDHVVYAPHFYPDMIREHTADEYDDEMVGLLREGTEVGAPVLVAEFGSPDADNLRAMLRTAGNEEAADIRAAYRAWNEKEETAKAEVLDRYGLGYIRPWYIDRGPWALFDEGFVETRRLELVVRPFPRRVQGAAPSWSFDYATHRFELALDIDPTVPASTEVALQVERFYPSGYDVTVDGERVDLHCGQGLLEIPAGMLGAGRHTLVVQASR
jgi:hypothetical protein